MSQSTTSNPASGLSTTTTTTTANGSLASALPPSSSVLPPNNSSPSTKMSLRPAANSTEWAERVQWYRLVQEELLWPFWDMKEQVLASQTRAVTVTDLLQDGVIPQAFPE